MTQETTVRPEAYILLWGAIWAIIWIVVAIVVGVAML